MTNDHLIFLPCSARRMTRPVFLPAALALLVLTGCTSSRTATERAVSRPGGEMREVEQRLRTETHRWQGTPYRFGGTSRNGVDCSAFVQALYRDALGLALPRATEDQVHVGTTVPARALQPGDLVFFRPTRKTRHVGVYLGGGEFAHAATSQGVTISYLDDPYWQTRYWTTRRVLPSLAEASPRPASTPRAVPPTTSSSSTPRRSGW